MPVNVMSVLSVALFDLLILLTLFPTPIRWILSKVINLSDGANLINFSLFFVVVNVLMLIGLFFEKWRLGLLDGQIKSLVYVSFSIIVIYTIIGLIALYQMYIVGLH
jgi:hypothetical protein